MLITSENQALEILDDDHRASLTREAAARYLEAHPNEHLIKRLVQALQDDDEGVRWAAACALARLGKAPMPELLTALMDPERVGPRLREGVYYVLSHSLGLSRWAAP